MTVPARKQIKDMSIFLLQKARWTTQVAVTWKRL